MKLAKMQADHVTLTEGNHDEISDKVHDTTTELLQKFE